MNRSRVLAAVAASLVFAGCGGGGSGGGGAPPCTTAGGACGASSACCTGSCQLGMCAPSAIGGQCATSADCYPTLGCLDGVCKNPSCRADTAACTLDSQCCGLNCRGNLTCGANQAPVANAGPDASAYKWKTITLDGSGSSDPDGDPLTYSWTLAVPAGTTPNLSSSTAQKPTFSANVAGTYVATLTVSDGNLTATASVTITVVNRPPVAVLGPNVVVPRNTLVRLSGAGSYDPDGDYLAYMWSFTSVPFGSTALLRELTAPWDYTFTPNVVGDYAVKLVVGDGSAISEASMVVTAVNVAPTVVVDAVGLINAGELLTATSTGTVDVNKDPLTFLWQLDRPVGSASTLSSTTSTTTTYVPDVPGTYTLYLDVSDGIVTSTGSKATVVYPKVVKLSHDVVAAACVDYCSDIYMVSQAPTNYLWHFYTYPGNGDMGTAPLPSPPLSLGLSPDDAPVVGLSGRVASYVNLTYAECPLPQWTDAAGALRTYDAGGVTLGPSVTLGTGKSARYTRFAYAVPAANANGGKGTLSVDMGNCTVTTAAGPEEGFQGGTALRPGTTSLYVLDGRVPGKVWIYDTSAGPATLVKTATLGAPPGTGIWFSATGATILTPEGTAFAADPVLVGVEWTLPLAGRLGNPGAADPPQRVVHASSGLTSTRIGALPAAPLDNEVRTYSAATLAQTASVPLPMIVTNGVASPVRGLFAGDQPGAFQAVWVIERTDTGVSPERWGIAPIVP